ncbi:d0f948fd-f124-4fa8-8a51-2a854afc55f3 [Sclerotinia trifoliorum]|uniref:D0f948fd-f124-4fa8-8a51-2a854afc55f3 n=1 Tax=Sclerotinia trifoliorum TaxID=28548 RepID=A0A8H2VVI7_9HELO|nr:d0f948fd-f124-4fa8-8a51-2a854afc55f3 [Sclerotinia trifoliorum]
MIGRIALSQVQRYIKRQFICQSSKPFSAHHNVLVLVQLSFFPSPQALRSPRKTSTPGVDHVSGRNKPVNFT